MSNLVKIIPSIPLALPLVPAPLEAEDVKSRSDRSNLDNWSTASLPTSASPTKMTLSGLLTATSCDRRQTRGAEKTAEAHTLARARINGSLSCIRPAVSTRTTSYAFSLAVRGSASVRDEEAITHHTQWRPWQSQRHPFRTLVRTIRSSASQHRDPYYGPTLRPTDRDS